MMIKEELKEAVKLNKKDRLWFVDYWANFVKTHSDEEWSRQQNVLINSVYGETAKKNRKLLEKQRES